jgi:hypothetical protein
MADLEYDILRAAAIHEVGHAWLGSTIGLDLKKINIWKSFMGLQVAGEVTIDRAKTLGIYEEDFDMLALFYVGGQEAESLWLARNHDITIYEARNITNTSSRYDRRHFRELAYCAGVVRGVVESQANAILTRHWPAIEMLADRLERQRSITADSVSAAVGSRNTDGSRRVQKVTPDMLTGANSGRN